MSPPKKQVNAGAEKAEEAAAVVQKPAATSTSKQTASAPPAAAAPPKAKTPPAKKAKVSPVKKFTNSKLRFTYLNSKDKRLKDIRWRNIPCAPPLSVNLPVVGDLTSGTRLFFTEKEGVDWASNASTKEHYPPLRGYGGHAPPFCIMQEAATTMDKLTILNWWRFQTLDQQKEIFARLDRVYRSPRTSTDRLAPDFWEKVKRYETEKARREEQRTRSPRPPRPPKEPKPKKEKPPPKTCIGWYGTKYDSIFKESFVAAMEQQTTTMVGAAVKPLPTVFPICHQLIKYKGADLLQFIQEGDSYVLRSKECIKDFAKDFEQPTTFRRCESCRNLVNTIASMRSGIESNPGLLDLSVVVEEQKKLLAEIRHKYDKARKREYKMKQKKQLDKEREAAKRKTAAHSLTNLGVHHSDEDDEDEDAEIIQYNNHPLPQHYAPRHHLY